MSASGRRSPGVLRASGRPLGRALGVEERENIGRQGLGEILGPLKVLAFRYEALTSVMQLVSLINKFNSSSYHCKCAAIVYRIGAVLNLGSLCLVATERRHWGLDAGELGSKCTKLVPEGCFRGR